MMKDGHWICGAFAGAVCVAPLPVAAKQACDTLHTSPETTVVCSSFRADGALWSIDRYLNGKKHGSQKWFYKDGSIEMASSFEHGCEVDTSRMFYPSGRLKRIEPYKDCKREGLFVLFSEDGDTLACGNARNGKSVGAHRAWYENGKRKWVRRYNDEGVRHGLSEEWFDNGARKDSLVYDNGILVEARSYYLTDRVRLWTRSRGERTVEGIWYAPDGEVSGRVKDGHGKGINYAEDGKTRYEFVYQDGDLVKIKEVK
jgi:antitoxin component YwqK of YwqJK toxin-antitoxin module